MKEYYREYFENIKDKRLESNEHAYRTDFENFLNRIKPDQVYIEQEPHREKKFGAPDFSVEKDGAIIGYIETKKPGENLRKVCRSKQIKRYLKLSDNFILTNYHEFMLFKDGDITPFKCSSLFYDTDLEDKKSKIEDKNIAETDKLFSNFFGSAPTNIADSEKLAVYLANRAKELKDFIIDIFKKAEENNFYHRMNGLYETFKKTLVKDLKKDEFADAYAQTVVYSFFIAHIFADEKITLHRASEFLPSNFKVIKEFFDFITLFYSESYEFKWIIKEIINLVNNISPELYKSLSFAKNEQADPYIYFYETFLKEFDPEKRKSKGVYYTPPEVVSFIIRSIDKILDKTFGITKGFADTSVTVLDFATGTGAFLLYIFQLVIKRIRIREEGNLSGVISDHILKNFYGFEYLIAPYAVAHLKLSRFLKDNSYRFKKGEELKIYLTDTLDDSAPKNQDIFPVISEEGKKANELKTKKGILVITGNPPYSNRSTGKKIEALITVYKPKGEKKLNLNDDYIKFIRFAHNKMEKQDKGIIGIITNNSFLNGLTHRKMREKLIKDFDEIYILNLHGSSRIGETSPDGSIDENVFDIMQGVSISIFIKKEKKDKKCSLYYYDLYGKRGDKYEFLEAHDVETVNWDKLRYEEFNNEFKSTRWGKNRFEEDLSFFSHISNIKKINGYGGFWGLTDIFEIFGSGIKTDRDDLLIDFDENALTIKMKKAFSGEYDAGFVKEYNIENSSSYKFKDKLEKENFKREHIFDIHYRPFDIRKIYYKVGVTSRPAFEVMKHFFKDDNLGICFIRNDYGATYFNYIFITDKIIDIHLTGGQTYIAPLYTISDQKRNGQKDIKELDRTELKPNFTEKFQGFIKKKYEPENPSPERILGYIYAIMHSPSYREKYLEFLKIYFPRIPFIDDYKKFIELSDIGWELIEHHLMKKDYPDDKISFSVQGSDVVEKIRFLEDKNAETGSIFINDKQFFGNVPISAWNFYIGGYNVLDKWLKSRKDRKLTFDEKRTFAKIIDILCFTEERMRHIENTIRF